MKPFLILGILLSVLLVSFIECTRVFPLPMNAHAHAPVSAPPPAVAATVEVHVQAPEAASDEPAVEDVPDDWEPKGAVVTHIAKVGDCELYRVHPRLSSTTVYITENTNRHVQCHVLQAK